MLLKIQDIHCGLLNHFEISKPLISYYKQIEIEKSDALLEKIEEGKNIALVSDAGTPGISDPGEVIVRKAIERGINVVPVPGACAAINAIIASGLSTDEFCFIGFLPVNASEKRKKLEENKNETKTLIFYEAPHKLIKTLETMLEVLGDRKAVVCKELTKIHENFERDNLSNLVKNITEPKGEYVVIIEGADKSKEDVEVENRNKMSLEEHYKYYEEKGWEKKDIIKQIAKERNVNKNEIYKHFIQ